MGCGGEREKGPPEQSQKWAFINLPDFKATTIWASLAYIWLWLMALVGIAVYAVDTFTAVNLLVFDKWSGQVKPEVPFKYTKWIFAVCILLSWLLCFYEWFRAIRVIRRGGVAESYMDPLAVTLQSMRSQGWRRFLVFTELTKSKKGADYVAFFVYFGFQGAIRVILAEGPRQAVNAMTLYAVMRADLIPTHGQHSNVAQFFLNLGALAEKQKEQAVILFSMLFTLVIWVFSALSLILAAIFYITFLWHYIPQRDGRLSVYCRRKIDRRLEKIVEHKVQSAIQEEEAKKQKAEKKAELKRMKTGDTASKEQLLQQPAMMRQPTLPQLGATPEMVKEDKLPEFALARQETNTTVATLPRYESRPPTRNGLQRQPTLPDISGGRPEMPSRQASDWASNQNYEPNASLLANAGYAGQAERRGSPAPSMPPPAYVSRQNSEASFGRPMPWRTMTQGSQASQRPFSPMSSNGSRGPPGQRFPVRSNTGFSFDTEPRSAVSPISPQDAYGRPLGRQNTQDTFRTAPMNRQDSQASPYDQPLMERRPTYGSQHSQQRSFSRPLLSAQRNPSSASQLQRAYSPPSEERQPTLPSLDDSYEMTQQPSFAAAPVDNGYVAFNPNMNLQPPRRNITVAGHAGTANNYFGAVTQDVPQRSATAPIDPRHTTGYGDIISDYGDSPRDATFPLRHASSVYSIPASDHTSLPTEPMPTLSRAYTDSASMLGPGHASSVYSADDGLRSPVEMRGPSPPAVPTLPRSQTDSWEASSNNRF